MTQVEEAVEKLSICHKNKEKASAEYKAAITALLDALENEEVVLADLFISLRFKVFELPKKERPGAKS